MAKKNSPQPVRPKRSALGSAQINTGGRAAKHVEKDLSVFADRDEADGLEYQHAVNSPRKDGHHLDSKVSAPYISYLY